LHDFRGKPEWLQTFVSGKVFEKKPQKQGMKIVLDQKLMTSISPYEDAF